MKEEQLIAGCIDNSRVAQKELFNKYYSEMYALCQYYCKNEDDAKWIVNQGFMDVFLNIKGFKGNSSLKTWIKRLMINRSIAFYHKEQKLNTRMLKVDNNSLMLFDNFTLDETAVQKLAYKDIISLVQSLPDNERIVFTQFVIDGFSHREIAESMNIPEGTSRSYLSNAKKILQKKLNTMNYDGQSKNFKSNL